MEEQRGHLLRIAYQSETIVRQALDGAYRDGFFGGTVDPSILGSRRLRSVIRDLNEDFIDAMLIGGGHRQILSASTLTESNDHDRIATNRYLQDWAPSFVFQTSFWFKWNLGTDWHKCIYEQPLESAYEFLELFLHHVADDRTCGVILQDVIEPAMEEIKKGLFQRLQELSSYNSRCHPFSYGKSFHDSLHRLRKDRNPSFEANDRALTCTGRAEGTLSDHCAALEVVDYLQAYYDGAPMNFTDNIAILAIENCLLLPLETLLTSKTVYEMALTKSNVRL
ncbi:hypothetical protein BDW59DRAFT_156342 [Aspergillus cavernicola]|uniref:GED domain-containing protein n=1 Tax=Aspergillus cavernicola TaxID=176166 RepID=A0ABR4J2Z7_9EURO